MAQQIRTDAAVILDVSPCRHQSFKFKSKLTEILSSPDVHEHVVLADAVEVGLVDHEEAPRDHGRADGRRGVGLGCCSVMS